MRFYAGILIAVLIALSSGCASTAIYTSQGSNQVMMAIHGGDIGKIKAYLAKGNDIDAEVDTGYTLLGYGVLFNSYEIVKFLLAEGANPDKKDKHGLLVSFHAKDRKMLELLEAGGVDLTATNVFGGTLLRRVNSMLGAFGKMDRSQAHIGKLIDDYQGMYDYLKGLTYSLLLNHASAGRLAELKAELDKGASLNELDHNGNNALHLAARQSHNAVVVFLINKKLSLNLKNSKGQTALDLVKASKNSTAKILSCAQNKHCKSVATFQLYLNKSCAEKGQIAPCLQAAKKDIHGVFISTSIQQRMAKHEYNKHCERFKYAGCFALLQRYSLFDISADIQAALDKYRAKGEALYVQSCGNNGRTVHCTSFVAKHPGFKSKAEINMALLYLAQQCRIKENGWIYQGRQCKAGYAHGMGIAINLNESLKYSGHFEQGHRVKGKVLKNSTLIFDGEFTDGQRHGKGVCFYQGSPEECKYYAGQRIDTLYKQRIERDKQRQTTARQQKIMNKKLAATRQASRQRAASAAVSTRSSSVGNKLADCAIMLGKKKLCDQIGGFGGMACMAMLPGGHNCF